jgi:nitrogen fixation protein NifB
MLGDCRSVLVSGIGETPREILVKSGLEVVQMSGFVADGLKAVYAGTGVNTLKGRRQPCTKGGCAGSGGGCL